MFKPISAAVVVVVVSVLHGPPPVLAQTIHYVDNVRSCDGLAPCYGTIMDAVKRAAPLDTIAVFPGVYHEAVVIANTGPLVLRAHDEKLTPVIVAPRSDGSVAITSSTGVQVQGFMLEATQAAGVTMQHASGVIEGNLVTALLGVTLQAAESCEVRNNTLLPGGITLSSGKNCVIEGNSIEGTGILLGGDPSGVKQSDLQGNLILGGGVALLGKNLKGNTVEANFVSNNAGDGLRLFVTNGGPGNVVTDNTSIGNTGCDLSDLSTHAVSNIWSHNRFATKCGAATD